MASCNTSICRLSYQVQYHHESLSWPALLGGGVLAIETAIDGALLRALALGWYGQPMIIPLNLIRHPQTIIPDVCDGELNRILKWGEQTLWTYSEALSSCKGKQATSVQVLVWGHDLGFWKQKTGAWYLLLRQLFQLKWPYTPSERLRYVSCWDNSMKANLSFLYFPLESCWRKRWQGSLSDHPSLAGEISVNVLRFFLFSSVESVCALKNLSALKTQIGLIIVQPLGTLPQMKK